VSKESVALMEEMGIPAKALVADLKELIKAHTVTTGEGGKPLAKLIAPNAKEVEALASKIVTGAHLSGVEAWVEKQLASLV